MKNLEDYLNRHEKLLIRHEKLLDELNKVCERLEKLDFEPPDVSAILKEEEELLNELEK